MLQRELAQTLPETPGVYFFHDGSHKLLYVGKAKCLRKRVLSYTYASRRRSCRISELVKRTEQVEYQECGSELEALITESRLIKQRQPPFNRAQRRFRRFRFIRIGWGEAFPRVSVTAEIADDEASYFGPFHHRAAAEEAHDVLHKLFPLRTCETPIRPRADARPCFEYHLERCLAPCTAKVSPEAYEQILEDVACFLRGENDRFLERLARRRDEAAGALLFEKAAYLQRQIEQIEAVLERHRFCVDSVEHNDVAVVGQPSAEGQTVMLIRQGKLAAHEALGRCPCRCRKRLHQRIAEIYLGAPLQQVCTPYDVDAMNIISNWLYHRRGEQAIVRFNRDLDWFTESILDRAAQLCLSSSESS